MPQNGLVDVNSLIEQPSASQEVDVTSLIENPKKKESTTSNTSSPASVVQSNTSLKNGQIDNGQESNPSVTQPSELSPTSLIASSQVKKTPEGQNEFDPTHLLQRTTFDNQIISDAQNKLQVNPNDDKAIYQMGYGYLKAGNNDVAKKAFNDALLINPDNANALRGLGYVAAKEGKHDEAAQYNLQALKISNSPTDLRNVTENQINQNLTGYGQDELNQLNEVIKASPDDYRAWQLKAQVEKKLGNNDAARESENQALGTYIGQFQPPSPVQHDKYEVVQKDSDHYEVKNLQNGNIAFTFNNKEQADAKANDLSAVRFKSFDEMQGESHAALVAKYGKFQAGLLDPVGYVANNAEAIGSGVKDIYEGAKKEVTGNFTDGALQMLKGSLQAGFGALAFTPATAAGYYTFTQGMNGADELTHDKASQYAFSTLQTLMPDTLGDKNLTERERNIRDVGNIGISLAAFHAFELAKSGSKGAADKINEVVTKYNRGDNLSVDETRTLGEATDASLQPQTINVIQKAAEELPKDSSPELIAKLAAIPPKISQQIPEHLSPETKIEVADKLQQIDGQEKLKEQHGAAFAPIYDHNIEALNNQIKEASGIKEDQAPPKPKKEGETPEPKIPEGWRELKKDELIPTGAKVTFDFKGTGKTITDAPEVKMEIKPQESGKIAEREAINEEIEPRLFALRDKFRNEVGFDEINKNIDREKAQKIYDGLINTEIEWLKNNPVHTITLVQDNPFRALKTYNEIAKEAGLNTIDLNKLQAEYNFNENRFKNEINTEVKPQESIVQDKVVGSGGGGDVWYHGSTTGEMNFDQETKGNQLPYGVHFTQDNNIAHDFSTGETKGKATGKEGKVIEAKINAPNLFDVSKKGIYREGTKEFDILNQIAKKAKIKDYVLNVNESGTAIHKSSLKGNEQRAIDPSHVLDNAKMADVKEILQKNGYDAAIKYAMRSSKDPMGSSVVYTDAIAVLDKKLVEQPLPTKEVKDNPIVQGNEVPNTITENTVTETPPTNESPIRQPETGTVLESNTGDQNITGGGEKTGGDTGVVSEEKAQEPPKEPPTEITVPEQLPPDEKQKSILNRLLQSSNISEESKQGLTEKGLTYLPKTHEEARGLATEIVNQLGSDEAVLQAEARKFSKGVNSAVFAEAIDQSVLKEQEAKTPQEKLSAAKKWADYADRYDEWARSLGTDISQIQDFYKKSPLGIVLKAEKNFERRADEIIEPITKDVKSALEELKGTPELENYIKERIDEAVAKKKTTRKEKVDSFFDKLKIDNKGNLGAYIIPPQIWNGAVEIMRKATHAGLSVADIVERGIAHINSKYKDGWDEDGFRKEYQQKIAELQKATRFDLSEEQKKLVLEKWRKKLKGLKEDDRKFLLTKAINHIVENGGLEYNDFKKMYAEALGLPKMTDELRGKIMQLGKDINDADKAALELQSKRTAESLKAYDEAVNKRDKASRDINELLAKPKTPFSTFLNLMRLNTLTPISMVANVGYNVTILPIRAAIGAMQAGMDAILTPILSKKFPDAKISEQPQVKPFGSLSEYAKGLKIGGQKSLRQFLTGLTDRDYFQKEIRQNIKPFQSFRELRDWAQGKKKLQTTQVINNLLEASPLGILAEVHARALNIGDKAFRYAEEYKTADMLAKQKGLSGIDAEIFKRLPDEESRQKIILAGEKAILAQENFASHIQEGIGRTVDSFVEKYPATKAPIKAAKLAYTATQPYLKIPMNAAVFTFEMTLPEFTLAMGAAKAVKGDRVEALKYFSKAATGYAIRGVATQMAANGILIPQTQSDRERRGLSQYIAPYSMNYSAFRRWVLGGDPKLQDGDVIVNLTHFGALGVMLGASAQAQQDKNQAKMQGETSGYLNQLWSTLGYNAQTGFEQGVFNGTTALTQALFNGGWNQYLNSSLNVLENAVEPSEVSLLSKSLRDTKPDLGAMTTMEKLSSNLKLRTFGGKDIPADVNLWGEDIKSTPEGRNKAAYYFFDITKYSNADKQQFGSSLADLYQRTSDPRSFPAEPQPKITTNKKVVKLNPVQYHEFKKIVGQQRKSLTSALFSSTEYHNADDAKKIELLNKQYNVGLEEGKDIFEAKYPSIFTEQKTTNPDTRDQNSRSNQSTRRVPIGR